MEAETAAKELVRLIPKMFRMMSAEMRCIDPCLSPAHMRVLGYLTERSYHLGELADRQGVTMATMSNTVGALLERGWVSRTVNQQDRRKVTITITDSGKSLLKQIHSRLELRVAETLQGFRSTDLELLSRTLSEIQVRINVDEVTGPCDMQDHFSDQTAGSGSQNIEGNLR